MSDRLGESDARLYESLSVAEQQDLYDRAARDYIAWLRDLTVEQVEGHFAEGKRLDWYVLHPRSSPRCQKCGETVLERRWGRDHVDWQCLEPTCREFWEWKAH